MIHDTINPISHLNDYEAGQFLSWCRHQFVLPPSECRELAERLEHLLTVTVLRRMESEIKERTAEAERKKQFDEAAKRWDELRNQVTECSPQKAKMFKSKPDGELFNIAFIYDEDRDERVLEAIDQLKGDQDIIALEEHKGTLKIYTLAPKMRASINVWGDSWTVEEYTPYKKTWRLVDKYLFGDILADRMAEK